MLVKILNKCASGTDFPSCWWPGNKMVHCGFIISKTYVNSRFIFWGAPTVQKENALFDKGGELHQLMFKKSQLEEPQII